MHPALQRMLNTTVTLEPYVSQDAYGMPSYGPAQTVAARVEWRIRRIVDMQGVERISRAKVFLDGSVAVQLKDRLALKDGTTPPILALYSPTERRGSAAHHHEVLF